MSTKFMNFLAMTWFLSVLICLAMEGSYFGTNEASVIHDLRFMIQIKLGNIITIPAPNLNFFRGVFRLLTWDYSFYQGGFAILRYFWIATLTSGAVWGIGSVFAPIFANLLRIR